MNLISKILSLWTLIRCHAGRRVCFSGLLVNRRGCTKPSIFSVDKTTTLPMFYRALIRLKNLSPPFKKRFTIVIIHFLRLT